MPTAAVDRDVAHVRFAAEVREGCVDLLAKFARWRNDGRGYGRAVCYPRRSQDRRYEDRCFACSVWARPMTSFP